ncbi:MAG: hypothetical protein LBB98_09380 [Treponema sp.]|jgi:hypothetical protein|nr:hypothetical protein [Treponema sp.]
MKAVVLALSAAILIGCASTRAAVPPPSESAGEYREIQGEIQKQQTDLAITGEKLKEGTKGIVEGITNLEAAIPASPGQIRNSFAKSTIR